MDLKEILEKLHIEELNEMQKKTYDNVLDTDKDIVILSPTGTGKTRLHAPADKDAES